MSNPYFSNSDVFGEPRRTANRRPGVGGVTTAPAQQAPWAGQAPQYGQAGAYGAQSADAASLDAMYNAPSATTADTKRLTYDDVIVKTGGLLALLVVVAAATWQLAPGLWPIGMIVGLVLGLVNSFKRNPSPVLIVLYTIAQGVFLGGISFAFENFTFDGETAASGVVLQAVLATFVTFGVALFLYKSGRVRVTPKFTRFLVIALVAFLAFQLINLVLVWTGVLAGAGARGGTIGIIVGLVAIGLATMSLIVDFDSIKRGVDQGVPARFAWSAAFGLMVTLIWLYLEFLRLLALLQGRD